MRLPDEIIRKLPVFTVSGERLGRVAGLVVDTATHSIVQYLVDQSRLPVGLLPKELVIHFSQVVSLDDEKMVVKDETLTEMELAEALKTVPSATNEAPASMARLDCRVE
ncbi:MAG: PRC-barrel domain-containing protein [Patescibacteria group bacterium]|nr:PRC-barrel domain-containing protein [Patescibacteria group bacterium]